MTHFMNCVNDKNMAQIKPRMFEQKYCVGAPDYEEVSLKVILERWGYEHLYDDMIKLLWSKVKNHPTEHICVYYDNGSMDNRQTVQKLLGWDIFDEQTKRYVLVGGVLFHNGEMSFHT